MNAELKVGSVEETITVTGASAGRRRAERAHAAGVEDRDARRAARPASATSTQLASLTLGAMPSSAGRNDVGGDKGERSTGISLHGSRGDDGRHELGRDEHERVLRRRRRPAAHLQVQHGRWWPSRWWIPAATRAETETGGANVNMVPQGRRQPVQPVRHGQLHATSWRSSAKRARRSDRSRQRARPEQHEAGLGLRHRRRRPDQARTRSGSTRRHRWWGSQSYGANNYFNKSTNPYVVHARPGPARVRGHLDYRDYGGRVDVAG